MSVSGKYKAVIIGCGNIAGGYDSPSSQHIFSHAHALLRHSRTILSGVYDIDFKKSMRFARKWNTVPFLKLSDLFSSTCPDFVYVCVPTDSHLELLSSILEYKPKAVICEKTLGNDICFAKEIIKKFKKEKIPLLVDYTRRFDHTVRKIKSNVDAGNYGSFINASLIYAKGILHNGSHAINLLRYFFGEMKSCQVLSAIFDYKKSDPTMDVFLEFKNGVNIHLISANETYYSIFEFDLLFSKARLRFEDFGLKLVIQNICRDPYFPGCRRLGQGRIIKTKLDYALLNLINNLINHIEKRETLYCDGEDAINTQETVLRIIKKYNISKVKLA